MPKSKENGGIFTKQWISKGLTNFLPCTNGTERVPHGFFVKLSKPQYMRSYEWSAWKNAV